MRTFLAIFLLAVLTVFVLMGVRGQKFRDEPLELFPDMDRQAKFHPQDYTPFFADGSTDQRPPAGTVPTLNSMQAEFVHLRPYDYLDNAKLDNPYMVTGKDAEGEWGRGFPVPVNYTMMERGREQYEIYCTTCHGASGDGNGITKSYGMIATPTYHDTRLREMAEGELFNTITHGKNTMGAYGYKIPVEDRWAIVAYLRALQRAQNATAEDVPADVRSTLGL